MLLATTTGDKRTGVQLCPHTFFQRLGFRRNLFRALFPADRPRAVLVVKRIARFARFARTGSSSGTTSESQRSRQTSTFATERVSTSAASPGKPTTTRSSRKRCVRHSTLVCGFFMVDILLCFSAPRHSCLVCLFTHPSRLFVSCPRLYYLGFLGRPPRQEVEVHVRVQRRRGKVVQYHSREATGPPLSPAGV